MKRWLDSFSEAFRELETCSSVCCEISELYLHSLGQEQHKLLFDVNVFVAEVRASLPDWRNRLLETSGQGDVDRLCDAIEDYLKHLSGLDEEDPFEVMMQKLRTVASEVVEVMHESYSSTGFAIRKITPEQARERFVAVGLLSE